MPKNRRLLSLVAFLVTLDLISRVLGFGTTIHAQGPTSGDACVTPSATATVGATASATASATPSPTRAPTATATATATATPTAAATPAPAPGALLKGINLAGGAVTIDGRRWQSYAEALADGFTVANAQTWSGTYGFPISPAADADTKAMLESAVWRGSPPNGEGLTLSQALPNGAYQVYVWSLENYVGYYRDMTLELEGVTVATGIGNLPHGAWQRYGPYSATVADGALTLGVLRTSKGDPGLMGLAIYAAGGEAAPVPTPTPVPAATATATATPAPVPDGTLRIMPLGDSITDGYDVPGGYRINIWQRSLTDGVAIDFLGSQANGPDSLEDKDHEGHPGWKIHDIAGSVGSWLAGYRPDIILLMIGSNDMNADHDVPNAPSRLGALIDQITVARPTAQVIVASIPPIGDPGRNERVVAYNATIPDMVATRAAQGKKVAYVDIYRVISTTDLSDGIHPNADGYARMATVWYDALVNLGLWPRPPSATATPTAAPPPSATATVGATASATASATPSPTRAPTATATATATATPTAAATPAPAPGALLKGINLAGGAVTIDGRRWQSYAEALADGFTVANAQTWSGTYGFPISPAADADTKAMLESAVWRGSPPNGEGLTLSQALPNGAYQVYVWSLENYVGYYRDMTLELEGVTVATGIGNLPHGAWQRYGPYSATVADGALTLGVLRTSKGDPGLMGLAIYAADGASAPMAGAMVPAAAATAIPTAAASPTAIPTAAASPTAIPTAAASPTAIPTAAAPAATATETT